MILFSKKPYQFVSCMDGEIIDITSVSDPVFAEKTMGDGFAYIPRTGKVFAPFDGEVIMVFKTKHAIGLKDKHGLEFLIHIGLDTVKLNGQGFELFVNENDTINKGDLLVEFDIDLIKATGYSLESCIILTNLSKRFVLLTKGEVMFGQSDIFSIR